MALTASPPVARSRSGSIERCRSDRELLVRFAETGEQQIRAALVERFMPLAQRVASRYRRAEEPFDDLLQVASIGLLKAIDRFDPTRDCAFSSYAVPTIAGELRRYFRDRAWSVRPPRDLQERTLRVERAITELTRDAGRAPTVDQIAEKLDLLQEEVLEALEAHGAQRATSLDALRGGVDDSNETLGDSMGDYDEGFARAEDRTTVEALSAVLDDREREVLRLRFEQDLTQAEIGELIGVSQMQVSRIVRRSLAKLQAAAAGELPTGG